MKRLLNRCIAALLTLAMIAALVPRFPSSVVAANGTNEPENLITNGDFENDLTGWTKGTSPDTILIDDTSATDKALKINAVSGAYTNFSQKGMPATAGETYALSFDYKLNLTTLGSDTIVGRLIFRDANGASITIPAVNKKEYDVKAEKVSVKDWTKKTDQVVAPEGTVTVDLIFWIWLDSVGECWIDDVSLLPVVESNQPSESEELITNGDFENDLTGWTKGTSPDTILIDDTSATDKALKVNAVSGAYTNFSQKGMPATAGETYALSFDYKLNLTTLGSDTIVGRLIFRDANGASITIPAVNKKEYDVKAEKVSVKDWTKKTGQVVAPEGTVTVDLIFWVWLDSVGECWIDDVSLLHVIDSDDSDDPDDSEEPSGPSTPSIPSDKTWNPDNMLEDDNYDFSEVADSTSKAPADWTLNANGKDRISVVTDPKNSENTCLVIDAETKPVTDNMPVAAYSAYMPVTVGDIVKVSADVMGTGSHGVYIRFYDSIGGTLKGSKDGWKKDNATWETLTVQAEVPEGANYAQVWLYVGKETAVHYYDNIILKKVENQTPAGPTNPNTPTIPTTPVVPAGPFPADNMLQNYNFSFEEKLTGSDFPANWASYGNTAKATATVVTTEKYVGNSSLLIKNDNPASNVGLYSAFIPVTPGDTLSLTMYVKGTGEHGAFLRFYGSADLSSNLGESYQKYNSKETNGSDWSPLTVTSGVKVPEGANYACVLFWLGSGKPGEHYFDNIVLKKVENQAPSGPFPADNMLQNYNFSFEKIAEGSTFPLNWFNWRAPENQPATVVTTEKYDGNSSLLIKNNNPAEIIGLYSVFVPVTPGDTISLTMQVKGTGEHGAMLQFYADANGSSAISKKEAYKTDNADWTPLTVTSGVDVPEGANYARVLLWMGSGKPGEHYFDNIVLKKVENQTPSTPSIPSDKTWNPDNMLEEDNFDFSEAVSATNKLPADWTVNANGTDRISIVTDPKNSENSCVIIDAQTTPVTDGMPVAAYSAFMPVEVGKIVKVSADVMGTGGHGVYIRFYDRIGGSLKGSKDGWKNNNATWETLTVQAEVPEGANYAQVWLYVGKEAAVHYYDNIVVKVSDGIPSSSNTPVAPSGPFPLENVLQNYNFSFEETIAGSTFPLGWFNWNIPENDPATVITTDKTDGNSCLLIKNNDPAETVGLYSVYFPVTAGDIISASLYAKGTGEHGAVLRFYEGVGSSYLKNDDKAVYSKTADWKKLTITSGTVVPEGATVARILLWMGTSGAGEHYYDNVSVTIKSMAGHKMTAIDAKAPTLEAPGNIAYWSCECGKLFADAEHESEITDAKAVVLPKLTGGSNLLEPYNPSFEWGVVGGVPVGWTDRASSKNYYTVVSGDAYNGDKALKLTVDDSVDHPLGIYSSYFQLDDSMESLSVMMSVKGEGDAMFYMYYYDENHALLANVEGDKGWIKESAIPTWSQIYAKFPVPEGAKYGRIMLYRSNNSKGTIYFDDILVKEYEAGDGIIRPTKFTDSFENGASSTELPWGWSYYTDATRNTATEKYLELLDITKDKLPEGAPTTAPDGKHILRFTQVNEGEKIRGIYSPYIDVSNMKGVYAGIDVYGDGITQIYIMYYDENYKCPEDSAWRVYTYDTFAGAWGTLSVEAPVPEGAKYARILLNKSFRDQYCGTVYLDRAMLMETEVVVTDVVPEVPELVEYDWTIAVDSHPRTYFTAAELRRIKKFANDEELTAMGYSGAEAYADLIREADQYLDETTMTKMWGSSGVHVTYLKFPVYPVLEDPSCREEFQYHWTYPDQVAYLPYMTNVCESLMVRMQTLAVAYSISGDTKYAERAVQYATDMSKWKYWVGEWETIINSTTYHELSAQPTASCITGVAAVYDLCFDQLTEAQKTLIEEALIEKGLEPMYHDVMPRMQRGRDMDHMSATFIACCAIMNESNIDRLSKYLNAVMQYTQWIFDWYNAGHNEGYDYAAYGVDRLFEGMGIMERTTGIAGMLDHPFATTTLRDWILAGVETGAGTSVGFSDSPYIAEFGRTVCVMAQRGDKDMGYLLTRAGGTAESYYKLIYTNISADNILQPEDDYRNVITVETMGIGSLRTGWGALDKVMVLFSDDYNVDHAHWEANSIFMAMDGQWLIKDRGYGSIAVGQPKTTYDQKYGVNSIFVDGKPQTVKGAGSVTEVLASELYGQLLGEARKAFGKKDGEYVLDKFDRNVVMFNHDSESYYVVIDDLAAPKEHVYGFNMYYESYDRLEVDGTETGLTAPVAGNHIAMLKKGRVLHYEFAGAPLNISAEYFTQGDSTFGPLLRASSKATKKHQFMTVISVDPQYDGIITIDEQVDLLTARSSKLKVENPDGWSWSSSNNSGQVVALPMGSQYGVNMFRARDVGDWISFPFEVEETGDYIFSLKLGSFNQYNGTWQAYLDGEPIGEPYYAKSNLNQVIAVEMGSFEVTAGKHTIKMELIGDVETEDLDWGTLISLGVVILEKEGSSLGYGDTKILESYDTETTLGATIRYGTVLNDIILSNKGTGTMSGGGLFSDGKQATAMGVYENDIKEGFSIVSGTSLKYGDLVLMTSDGPVSLTADYRFAKVPVKNTDDDNPLELDEDFDVDEPTTVVMFSAEDARVISIQVGNDAPFTVTIDDEEVASTFADGLLTVSVPAGEHEIRIVGTHHCIFDQKATNIMNVKTWATCTEATVYYVSCYCGKNGTETFVDGEPRGHDIVAVSGKEPTEYEDGCIAYYVCKTCGKFFADANGTQELSASDVILPCLTQPVDYGWIIWVVVGCAIIAVGATTGFILKFRFGFFAGKKKTEEEFLETQAEESETEEE